MMRFLSATAKRDHFIVAVVINAAFNVAVVGSQERRMSSVDGEGRWQELGDGSGHKNSVV